MGGLEILGLILIVLSFICIGIEVVVPGFGAPGILGIACLIAGIVLTAHTVVQALILSAILAVQMVLVIGCIMWLFSSGKIEHPLVLRDKLETDSGYIGSESMEYLIGQKGIAQTDLHPAGKIVVNELVLDVVSDGRFIAKGSPVVLSAVRNGSLVATALEIED